MSGPEDKAAMKELGGAPHEALLDAVVEPGMEGFSEFVNWFVRAGLAWALAAPANQYPTTLHLTKSGTRFLDTNGDHPLLPGFVERGPPRPEMLGTAR